MFAESEMDQAEESVLKRLLDSDPSLRWQVMRDLSDSPGVIVAAERARVATEGWGHSCSPHKAPMGDGVGYVEPRVELDDACTVVTYSHEA